MRRLEIDDLIHGVNGFAAADLAAHGKDPRLQMLVEGRFVLFDSFFRTRSEYDNRTAFPQYLQ